jgi:AcrR family transcriptional regulator
MSAVKVQRTSRSGSRRQVILQQAVVVFAGDGFHRADVQRVADQAGVGKGTACRHFGNKRKLFLATARWCVEQLGQFADQRLGGESGIAAMAASKGVAEVLRQIASACAACYQRHPQAVEIMIMERAVFRESVYPTHLMDRAETRKRLDELVASVIAGGEFRKGNPATIVDAFADLLFGNIVNGCIGGSKSRLHRRIPDSIEIFLRGVVASAPGP